MNVIIRDVKPEDINFIKATWFKGQQRHEQRIAPSIFAEGMNRRMTRLLFSCTVQVLCFPEVPDEIVGWSCTSRETLHFLYVKASYREQGFASLLLKAQPQLRYYTCTLDKETRDLADRKSQLKYNPYILEQL